MIVFGQDDLYRADYVFNACGFSLGSMTIFCHDIDFRALVRCNDCNIV
mgnify:CR=1 FL=1